MYYCQFCNEFSNSSVYVLQTDTLKTARSLALFKMKTNETIHHVNIYADDYTLLECCFA